jgi:hypothetical protein
MTTGGGAVGGSAVGAPACPGFHRWRIETESPRSERSTVGIGTAGGIDARPGLSRRGDATGRCTVRQIIAD